MAEVAKVSKAAKVSEERMMIQVLHNRECNFWQTTWEMLDELIAEKKLDAVLEEVLIADDAEAATYRFFGSPQVMINGRDIDPEASRVTNFHSSGCRPYFSAGSAYDYPPREILEAALQAATQQ